MPRTLSPEIAALAATRQAHTLHTLDLTSGAAVWRFATGTVTIAGNAYLPYLKWDAPITYYRSTQLDRMTLKIQNVSLFWTNEQKLSVLEGALGVFSRLYLDCGQSLHLFSGRLDGHVTNYDVAELELVSAFDPTSRQIPKRPFSALCAWPFPPTATDPHCRYAGAPTTCSKTFTRCGELGQQHSFAGFFHLDRETQRSVPPPPAPGGEGDIFDLELEVSQC